MEKKIELIPGTRVTIETTSNGSTVTIYEEEKPNWTFKDGDFICTECNGKMFIGILEGDYRGEDRPIHMHCAITGEECIPHSITIGPECRRHDTTATFLDKIKLTTLLNNIGLRWNSISKEFEKIRWIPKDGERYHFVNGQLIPLYTTFHTSSPSDKKYLSTGNFFKTKEQAEDAAERARKLFAEIQSDLYK